MSVSSAHGTDYSWVTFDDDETIVWEGQPRVVSVAKTAAVLFGIAIGLVLYDPLAAGLGVVAAAGLTFVAYKRTLNTDYVLTVDILTRLQAG